MVKMNAPNSEVKAQAKVLQDRLSNAMNEVKAFAQRFQEQQQAMQAQGGGLDPETEQKIISMQALTDSKMQANSKSNAQRTAVRQTQDEMKMQREAEKFQQEQAQRAQEHAQEMALQAQKDALEVTKAASLATIEVEKSKKTAAAKTAKPHKQASSG